MGRKYFWYCNVCHGQNSVYDGECQFCECQPGCIRDNCSGPYHPCTECGAHTITDCHCGLPEVSNV